MSLAGRCSLVTGAARGIGFATARTLCEAGMRVALNDINVPELHQVVADLKTAGYEAYLAPGDVSNRAVVERIVEEIQQEIGPLWLLVANAGVFSAAPTLDFSEEEWDRTFASDVKAVFLCSQAAARPMMASGAGRIVVISSIAGHIVRTGQIAYCAAKAAAIHFARCLAVELAPNGITVNCLCPGMTDSAMLRQTSARRGIAIEDYVAMIPSGQLANAEDHAQTILWLASDAASHVTGQVISVDGGQSLHHVLTKS
jgi:2,3-dihydro-2,3-dihydroxybenzoate dehydrogenase